MHSQVYMLAWKSRVIGGIAVASLGAASACASRATPAGEETAMDTAAAVTYQRDVRPILERKCAECHRDGSFAPFALQTYADASKRARLIASAVTERRMPPWLPERGCADFEGDRSLSDAEIATIAAWAQAGAPEGDPAAAPPSVAPPRRGLSRVDLTLPMPAAYTPAGAPDDYRCFMIDWPRAEKAYVTGFRGKPGAAKIVHHMLAFAVTKDDVAGYQALDDKEPGAGWTCFGGPGGGGLPRSLGAWAPGNTGADFPAGIGIAIEPGSKLVVQMHYNLAAGSPEPDVSSIELAVADRVDKEAFIMPFVNPQWPLRRAMPIPAGEADAVHAYTASPQLFQQLSEGVVPPGEGFNVYSTLFHMHTRGTVGKLGIEHADGRKECLMDTRRWDFHWQEDYRYVTPKRVEPGDKLSIECHWDNSGAKGRPMELNWGEGTNDEMCLAGMLVSR